MTTITATQLIRDLATSLEAHLDDDAGAEADEALVKEARAWLSRQGG